MNRDEYTYVNINNSDNDTYKLDDKYLMKSVGDFISFMIEDSIEKVIFNVGTTVIKLRRKWAGFFYWAVRVPREQ
jgi:hypothetical protein